MSPPRFLLEKYGKELSENKRVKSIEGVIFKGKLYSAFACSGSCPVPGHVILTCKLHISGKI